MQTQQQQPPYRADDDDLDVSADLTGSFLKQADFSDDERVLFIITAVKKEHFAASNGRPEADQWVVTLSRTGREQRFGLNKTNLALLAKWYGKKATAWIGKPIIVWKDPTVTFGGRLVGGLRVAKPLAAEVEGLDDIGI
jgi:hypothetical protein